MLPEPRRSPYPLLFCTLMLTSSLVPLDSKMPAHNNCSDSDSDNESALTDVETAVELGIPSGEITSIEDLGDPMVSRIGGIPVRAHVLIVFEYPVLNLLIPLFLMHTPISTILVLFALCPSVVPFKVSASIRFLALQHLRFACGAASSTVVSSTG